MIGIIDGLCSDDDLSSSSLGCIMLQVRFKSLVSGSHYHTNRRLNIALLVTRSHIHIIDFKAHFLVLLKDILRREECLKVWIQIITDALSFASFLPSLILALYVEEALGV